MLDLIQARTSLWLPFGDEPWQVYALIFLLQNTAAAVPPTFLATIPDLLSQEARHTRALSLSWLACLLATIVRRVRCCCAPVPG